MNDIDIWRSAKLLVDQHGADAPIRAAQRADELLAADDIEGRAVWLRILETVKELIAMEPPGRVLRPGTIPCPARSSLAAS